VSAQLEVDLEPTPLHACDHSAEMRAEYEAIGRSNYYAHRKRERRNEVDGVPVLFGGAVVLQHQQIGASHCGALDWSWHTECGFEPVLPDGMSAEPPPDPDMAYENFLATPVLPSFQNPPSTVICARCHSVDGIAMHLYESGCLQAAFESMRGFSGEFWDCVRLELRRMPLTCAQVWAGELAPEAPP